MAQRSTQRPVKPKIAGSNPAAPATHKGLEQARGVYLLSYLWCRHTHAGVVPRGGTDYAGVAQAVRALRGMHPDKQAVGIAATLM